MTTAQHLVEISYAPPHVLNGGHRARCSCGWASDSYAQIADAQRAIEVHQRKAAREDFDGLLARSSIGAAIADIKQRGIDAHLADLEQELRPRRARKANESPR